MLTVRRSTVQGIPALNNTAQQSLHKQATLEDCKVHCLKFCMQSSSFWCKTTEKLLQLKNALITVWFLFGISHFINIQNYLRQLLQSKSTLLRLLVTLHLKKLQDSAHFKLSMLIHSLSTFGNSLEQLLHPSFPYGLHYSKAKGFTPTCHEGSALKDSRRGTGNRPLQWFPLEHATLPCNSLPYSNIAKNFKMLSQFISS